MPKGNWGFLIVAFSAIVIIIAVAMGGHVYRWEYFTWLTCMATVSIAGYFYSRTK